jgi:hypothetical protein
MYLKFHTPYLTLTHQRQTKIHTSALLVPDTSPFEVETTIAKFKNYKLPDSDQIPAKTIQGGETLWIKSTYSLILF